MRIRLLPTLLPLLSLVTGGCADINRELNQLNGAATAAAAAPALTAPRIDVANVALVTRPSNVELGRALCPRVTSPAICMLLGAPSNVQFVFALQLTVHNDNAVPLPVVEALTAFTAYPGQSGGQNLGTVCLSMCNDPNACQPHPNACATTAPQIRTLQDFGGAAVGFLIAVATGQARFDNLRIKTIPAHGASTFSISLALEPNQLLTLIQRFGSDAIAMIKRGQAPQLSIPYRVEGSVWMDVANFGRLAAPFGPYNNSWAIQ